MLARRICEEKKSTYQWLRWTVSRVCNFLFWRRVIKGKQWTRAGTECDNTSKTVTDLENENPILALTICLVTTAYWTWKFPISILTSLSEKNYKYQSGATLNRRWNETFSAGSDEFAKRKNILTSDFGAKLSMEGENAVSLSCGRRKKEKTVNEPRELATGGSADNTSTNCDWPGKLPIKLVVTVQLVTIASWNWALADAMLAFYRKKLGKEGSKTLRSENSRTVSKLFPLN